MAARSWRFKSSRPHQRKYPGESLGIFSFIAVGGTFDGKREDEIGADFQIVRMPLDELVKIIENKSETMQSLHFTSIFFALNYLKRHAQK